MRIISEVSWYLTGWLTKPGAKIAVTTGAANTVSEVMNRRVPPSTPARACSAVRTTLL